VSLQVPDVAEAMDLGLKAATLISQKFPPPVKLEFEKVRQGRGCVWEGGGTGQGQEGVCGRHHAACVLFLCRHCLMKPSTQPACLRPPSVCCVWGRGGAAAAAFPLARNK
jgi:hypothetical protein